MCPKEFRANRRDRVVADRKSLCSPIAQTAATLFLFLVLVWSAGANAEQPTSYTSRALEIQTAASPSSRVTQSTSGSESQLILDGLKAAVDDIHRQTLGMYKIEYRKPLKAVRRGNQFIVDIHDLLLRSEQANVQVWIGNVELGVTPRPGGLYDFAVVFPPSFELRVSEHEVLGRVTVGKREMTGTWWADHETITALDAALEHIRIKSVDGT